MNQKEYEGTFHPEEDVSLSKYLLKHPEQNDQQCSLSTL
jgi:hypothetical protein